MNLESTEDTILGLHDRTGIPRSLTSTTTMSTNGITDNFAASLEKLAEKDFTSQASHSWYEDARRRALVAVRSLQQQLETPFEHARRTGWQEAANVMAIKIALDLGIFAELSKHDSKSGITILALAKATSTPEELVGRVMRHHTAWELVKELGSGRYAATSKSTAFLNPLVASNIEIWFRLCASAFSYCPKYLKEGHYEDLPIAGKGNFEKAMGNGLNLWQHMNENPEMGKLFAEFMVSFSEDRTLWTSLYPVEERLLHGADSTGALIVDVGGGVGNYMQRFHKLFPQSKGRLIVQDQKEVVAQANNDPEIEMQVHDFFTPQPVQGARAYFLHDILHDWSDEQCSKILGHIKDAMRGGYSKVLVSDLVVTTQNPDRFMTSLDMSMMAVLGAKERTEEQWRSLFENAGLKLANIFTASGDYNSLMEVVLGAK